MKPKLLATSDTIDGITSMINRYWYSSSYRVNPETLVIEHPSNDTSGYQVRLHKGRYRFEKTN